MALSNTRQVNQFPWSLSGLRTGGFFLSTRGAVCLPPEPNGATRTNHDGACTEAVDKEACRRVACMNQERGVAWPASPTATSSLSAFPRTEPSSLVPPELGTRLGLNVPTIPAVCFGLRCTTSLHSTSQRSTCMQPVDCLRASLVGQRSPWRAVCSWREAYNTVEIMWLVWDGFRLPGGRYLAGLPPAVREFGRLGAVTIATGQGGNIKG